MILTLDVTKSLSSLFSGFGKGHDDMSKSGIGKYEIYIGLFHMIQV